MLTDSIIDISKDRVLIGGKIIDIGNGISSYGHCWSKEPNPAIGSNVTTYDENNKTGFFISKIDGLERDSKYYIRAYMRNKNSVSYGEIINFQTKPIGTLKIETDVNYYLSGNSAVVFGFISDPGRGIINYGHCWSTDTIPSVLNDRTNFGSTDSITFYSSSLKNLSFNEEFFVRAYAKESDTTFYGQCIKVIVDVDPKPIIKAIELEITERRKHEYKVTITNFHSIAPIIQRGLCYDTIPYPTIENSYGISLTVGDTSIETFYKQEDKTYYVRPYATNMHGTGYGEVFKVSPIE